jgi:hypothetical protein
MKKALLAAGVLAALFPIQTLAGPADPSAIRITPIGTYASGVFDRSAAEIVAHDPRSQRLFVVNAAGSKVDVLDIRAPSTPRLLFSVDLAARGLGAVVNSVDVHQGLVVAAIESAVRTDPGRAVFMDADGNILASVEVGALPDMVTFTPDGSGCWWPTRANPATTTGSIRRDR